MTSRTNLFSGAKHVIHRAGMLSKQGGWYKTWTMRLFVLQGPFMLYYAQDGDTVPRGVIILDQDCRVTRNQLNRDLCFGVECHDRVFYLQASTPLEYENWIDSLERALRWRTEYPEWVMQCSALEMELQEYTGVCKDLTQREEQTRVEVEETRKRVEDMAAEIELKRVNGLVVDQEILGNATELQELREGLEESRKYLGAEAAEEATVVLALRVELEDLRKRVADLEEACLARRREKEVLKQALLKLRGQ